MKKNDLSNKKKRMIFALCATLVAAFAVAGVFVYVINKHDGSRDHTVVTTYNTIAFVTMDAVPETAAPVETTMDDNETTFDTFEETVVETSVKEEVDTVKYFNIPLDANIQDHIFKKCDEYGIDPALVISIIKKESNYRANVMGDNGRSYGLMQIQARWHQTRMTKLGVTDLLDPYQNITVGVDYLAELFRTGKSTEWVLMAYNGGSSYANSKQANGVVSKYVTDVLNYIERLNKESF